MRKIHVLINVCVVAILIASAALIQGNHASAATRATVSFATWSSNPTEQAGQKALVTAFQNKYHINVDFQVINGDYNAQMKTRITAGTAPDVFYVNSDHVQDF